MKSVAILLVALVLAPGLQASIYSTFPQQIPDTRPLPIPEETVPELRPLPPPVEAVVPELISINPCNACFDYMNDLIGQLTNVPAPEIPAHPELPELEPIEPEDLRPPSITVPEDLRPLPVPETPGVGINPIPIPVAPETDVRPLPIPSPPGVGINPIPIPILPEVGINIPIVTSELLEQDY